VWKALDLANGDSVHFKELIFSFFPHVVGVHEWEAGTKFSELFEIAPTTTIGRGFRMFRFTTVTDCPHDVLDENAADPLEADDLALQQLLGLVSKTTFLNDIIKVKGKCATSALEAYHSARLRYAPKRKFFTKKGAKIKSMLAILHWNTIQMAELDGNRRVMIQYQSYSKPRGEHRIITRKSTVEHPWKRIIVTRAMEQKRRYGPGVPIFADEDGEEMDIDVSIEDLFADSDTEVSSESESPSLLDD